MSASADYTRGFYFARVKLLLNLSEVLHIGCTNPKGVAATDHAALPPQFFSALKKLSTRPCAAPKPRATLARLSTTHAMDPPRAAAS